MIKKIVSIGLLLCSLALAGCTEKDEVSENQSNALEDKIHEQATTIEKYKRELEEAGLQISQLNDEKTLIESQLEIHQFDSVLKDTTISNLESTIQSTYESLFNKYGYYELAKLLGVFDPEQISKGMEIGELTVQNIELTMEDELIKLYRIKFSGEFQISGTLVTDEAYGGFLVLVDSKHFHQIPHRLDTLMRGNMLSKIENEAEMEKMIGKPLSVEDQLPIEAVFTNFSANYMYGSHDHDFATIVEIISK